MIKRSKTVSKRQINHSFSLTNQALTYRSPEAAQSDYEALSFIALKMGYKPDRVIKVDSCGAYYIGDERGRHLVCYSDRNQWQGSYLLITEGAIERQAQRLDAVITQSCDGEGILKVPSSVEPKALRRVLRASSER